MKKKIYSIIITLSLVLGVAFFTFTTISAFAQNPFEYNDGDDELAEPGSGGNSKRCLTNDIYYKDHMVSICSEGKCVRGDNRAAPPKNPNYNCN